MSPLLSIHAFMQIPPDELIVLDAGPLKRYEEKHIQGALHIDTDTRLASIKENTADGGRHPLPSPHQFAETLAHLGITPNSYVAVYDDKQGSNAAARFWWMLRACGHEKVQVLDGGLQAAEKAGVPLQSEMVIPQPTETYPVTEWQLPLADMQEVEKVSEDQAYVVIDVRDSYRYDGISEPIDTIAGHIPGAINIPYTENLDAEGNFLAANALHKKYQPLFEHRDNQNIIVHCGSGITACHTLLAMAAAGYKIPKLYVGSWSEWSRNNKKMVMKESA